MTGGYRERPIGYYFSPNIFLVESNRIRDLGGVCRMRRPPLWSSGQGFWLEIQRSRVRFPALPDFLSGNGSGTGCTQPRESREVN